MYLCFHLSKIRLEQSLAVHAFIKPLSAYIGKMELDEMHFSLPRGSHVLEGQRAVSQPSEPDYSRQFPHVPPTVTLEFF